MKTRIYRINAQSGDKKKTYMVRAATKAQALSLITRQIYTVKAANADEATAYLEAGGTILKYAPEQRFKAQEDFENEQSEAKEESPEEEETETTTEETETEEVSSDNLQSEDEDEL